MKQPSLTVIFFTVFIDLVGFGMVVPLLPVYGSKFGANGLMIGLIMASYSLMQFIFAPLWGRLSDRIGRRPVLLASTAVASVSYAIFGLGSEMTGSLALGLLLASRSLAGICGANISVAQAYIADISTPEDRSKKMGMIGMAFGLGFIFGPAIGAVSLKYLDHAGPGWVACCLCALNFIMAWFILPESLKPSHENAPQRPRVAQWLHTMRHPQIGLLIAVFFMANFAFTCYETTLGLLVGKNFHLDVETAEYAQTIAILFAYSGFIGALVQGGTIGRMVKRFGEPRVIAFSLLLVTLSMAPLPFVTGNSMLTMKTLFSGNGFSWWMLLLLLGLLAIGAGMTRPPLFGLLSILTPANEQGATLGVAQSMGSLARIIGPILAGLMFQKHTALPYVSAALLSLVTGIITWIWLTRQVEKRAIPDRAPGDTVP
ncbi:MAG: MFS transporter [Verrucomicrobiota bacterium]